MDFVQSLGSYLRSYAGLAALVGQRIYPVRAPDNPRSPYVVYRVSIQCENTLTESSPLDLAVITATGCSTGDSTHAGYEQAHQVADQIRAAIGFFRGSLAVSGKESAGSSTTLIEDNDAADFGVFEVAVTTEMYYQP